MSNKTSLNSTGVTVYQDDHDAAGQPGWNAVIKFHGGIGSVDGFCGQIACRVFGDLSAAVDGIIAASKEIGVIFLDAPGISPLVTYWPDWPIDGCRPPENWEAMILSENERLNWIDTSPPDVYYCKYCFKPLGDGEFCNDECEGSWDKEIPF
jgi:hypothetical protein